MSDRRISVRLDSEDDVAWLAAHGGTSKAVRAAIASYRTGKQNKKQRRLLRRIVQDQEQIIARLDALQAKFSR